MFEGLKKLVFIHSKSKISNDKYSKILNNSNISENTMKENKFTNIFNKIYQIIANQKKITNLKNFICLFAKKSIKDISNLLGILCTNILNTIKNAWKYICSNLLKFLFIATIIISFIIFDDFWELCINRIWINPIISSLVGNECWVIPIYSFFILIYYINEVINSKLINKTRLKFLLAFLVVYLFCFFSEKWDYSLIIPNNQYTAWTNIFILLPFIGELIIITKITFKNKSKNTQEEQCLEIEKVYNVEDSYQRNKLYITTYKTLESCFYSECSFAFGITGLWGSGKTTFINNLKEQYKKDTSVSIIEFEPWKSDTTDAIIRNFFTILCQELRLYIPNISSALDKYIDLLLDEDSAKPLKIVIKPLYRIFNPKLNPYKDIKSILEKSKHKTIVFIDDIDRLNVDEIKEILRLIRNTANFPFIQFIVAYDKDYVCKTLKRDGIYNPELYLKKFFNAEISLPKSEERIICNELQTRISKTINTIWGIPKEDTRIHNMVYYRSDEYTNSIIDCLLVPKILYTIRDVIRFNNLFFLLSETYREQKVEAEIEFQDLFYLELLNYRYSNIYSVLCNTPLSILKLNEYSLSLKPEAKEIIQKLNIDNQDIDIVYDILCYLFSHSRRTNSMSYLRNYSRYFMYRLDNKILTTSEFLRLDNIEEQNFKDHIDTLYTTKYPSEFENQILEILNQIPFNNKSHNNNVLYKKVYKIITQILTHTKLRSLRDEVTTVVLKHLRALQCIDKKHLREMLNLFNHVDFNTKPTPYFDMDNFLMSILFKENLAVKLRTEIKDDEYEIIHTFLSTTSNSIIVSSGLTTFIDNCRNNNINESNLLIPLTELSNIQLNYFINCKDKLSPEGFSLFSNCWENKNIATQQMRLRNEALNIMKEEIEKTPNKYFKMFIRKGDSSHPKFNTVFPELYYEAIFGSKENFEAFLDSCNSNSAEEKRVKNYWMLYKYNEYSPIKFKNQGNVQDKIDNCFRDEIRQLKELLYIKEQIDETGAINDELTNKFENNNLYIKLRGDILRIINNLKN